MTYTLTKAQRQQLIEALATRDLRLHSQCEAMLHSLAPNSSSNKDGANINPESPYKKPPPPPAAHGIKA